MKKIDLKKFKKLCKGVYRISPNSYYVLCSISHLPRYCTQIHMDSLLKKYKTFEALGEQYISRDVKRLIKAKVPVKSIMDMDDKTIHEEAKGIREYKKERKIERKQKREVKQAIRDSRVPIYYRPVKRPTASLMNDPEMIKDFTKHSCLLPTVYLDNNRKCDTCKYVEHCVCKIKSLLKKH